MHQQSRGTIYVIFTLFSLLSLHAEHRVAPLLRPRPEIINTQSLYTCPLLPTEYQSSRAEISISTQATKTFRPERIAQCLFSDDVLITTNKVAANTCNLFAIKRSCESIFVVAGNTITKCICHRWLANFFALPPDFKSTVYVKPQMTTNAIILEAFGSFSLGRSEWYCAASTACTYSRWHLHAREHITHAGIEGYGPGIFNATGIDRTQLQNSFLAFATGASHTSLTSIIIEPLTHAKISCSALHATTLADIHIALGWFALANEQHTIMIDINMAIPTSNRPRGYFLFEALTGNGHHWQIGTSLKSNITIFKDSSDNTCSLLTAFSIAHLFTTKHTRTFDIKKIPNSRYMLAQKQDIIPEYYAPIANLSTLPVLVSIPAQITISLAIRYSAHPFLWDIGYECWAQSSERICLKKPTPFDTSSWILKTNSPIIITTKDLDLTSACTKLRTHNLFMRFKYTMLKRHDLTPFIGCSAQVDFGQSAQLTASTSQQKNLNCALSFWRICAQFGLIFN